eukprot:3376557-Amphidinium_carterae.2
MCTSTRVTGVSKAKIFAHTQSTGEEIYGAQAVNDFERGKVASSSREPNDSVWETWKVSTMPGFLTKNTHAGQDC